MATNSTYFDASMLAFRDWPSIHPFRNGEDFLRGAEGVVPRALWPGKPAEVVPGEAFRQVYEPTATNGWPLGAVGDWYVNFGILGVLAGGAISGLLYRRIMTVWWEKGPWTPFTMAAVMAVVIFVVPTGFGAATTLDWVVWALPLLLCVRYLCGSRRAAATQIAAVAHR